MIVKIGDSFLEFNGVIEIERQIKLFDDISTVNGDYSYSFDVPNTSYNRDILGIKSVNSEIYWNIRIDAEILNNSGITIYYGYIQISEETKDSIVLNFFSGNLDWFNLLERNIRTYNLSIFNKEGSDPTTIEDTWDSTNGIIFPVVNRGALLTRKGPDLYDGDFQPFIYVKDVIRAVFSEHGIKIVGDLLDDPVYDKLITSNNGLSGIGDRIDSQKVYIGLGSNQVIAKNTETTIQFASTTAPFQNSENNNWDTTNYRYTFTENVKKFKVNASIKTTLSSSLQSTLIISIRYQGSTTLHTVNKSYGYISSSFNNTITIDVNSDDFNQATLPSGVGVGDYIDVRIEWTTSGSPTFTVLSGSFVRVEPVKFHKVYATSLLPDLKANEFVADIFKIFNVFCSYNSTSKILTVKKLDTVLKETPIDISDHVEIEGIQYQDFISNYSVRNNLGYDIQAFTEVDRYNQQNRIPYASGVIEIDNDFLDDEDDLVELNFISAWQQDVDFWGSLPRLEYVEAVEIGDLRTITSVTDNGDGYARFNFSGDALAGQLVRVKDATVDAYNGDFEIIVNTAGYVVLRDVLYSADADGSLIDLELQDQDNEDQCLLINRLNTSGNDIGYSGTLYFNNAALTSNFALAYFYYPDNGTLLGNFKGTSLSFGDPVDSNQRGLITSYYRSGENILNNSSMITCIGYIPEWLFNQLDFLSPIRLNFNNVTGLFLLNRITGYKGAIEPCEIELISIK